MVNYYTLIITLHVYFEFVGFCEQKYIAYDSFCGNVLYGKILTK